MGKHAAPATPTSRTRVAQRATAVAAGTFVLCLGAAAPAMATTGLPNPPLPVPIPQPVVDTVQTVTDVVGLPNPIAPTATTKTHHRHTTTHAAKPRVALHHTTAPTQTTRVTHTPTQVAQPAAAPVSFMHVQTAPTYRTATLNGQTPAVAKQTPVTRIAPAAGSQPLAGLPAVPAQQDTGRILVVALAVMLLGGLTSGHLKAIQQG